MAKEEPAAEVVAPKKKGKMFIIILAVVGVLVIGGGIGAYLLLSNPVAEKTAHGDEAEGEGAAEDEGGEGEGEAHAPVYIKLEAFTVNLADQESSDQESYLQTEIQLLVADATVGEKLNARLPEVRDAMIRLLSSKTAEDLSLQEGKDKLAGEIQKQINDLLGIKGKLKGVKKVLFGAFIIQ